MEGLIGARQLELLENGLAEFIENDGFVCLDDFFQPGHAQKLRDEIVRLNESGRMVANSVQFTDSTNGKVVVVEKPGIYEADLFDEKFRDFEPMEMFRKVFGEQGEALVQALSTVGYAQGLVRGTRGRVVKLQYNDGTGGCFPLHYDNPGKPNKRCLTCAIYLNPEWQDGDGGELRIVPFLSKPKVIAPRMNRLVIFKSDSMLHRVHPTKKERYCFTIWIDGCDVNADKDSTLRLSQSALDDIPGLAAALRSSAVQRLLARAAYREEFEKSLRDCMRGTPGSETMLLQHFAHLQSVRKNAGLSSLIETLRAYKKDEETDYL
mmetsp:Transcript_32252/g.51412  ORF Transcript_32252/g.51412 Transcript_32252/m.51412 type:complete len:321 (-) Transcript_32252:3656-4618(-)